VTGVQTCALPIYQKNTMTYASIESLNTINKNDYLRLVSAETKLTGGNMTKESISKFLKFLFALAMIFLCASQYLIWSHFGNVEKQLMQPMKSQTIYTPAPLKNCPIAYEGICYPVTKITAISCGAIAGHENVQECQVLFVSEQEITVKPEEKIIIKPSAND